MKLCASYQVLWWQEHEKCEIGYELLPHFQGKGIMNEAASVIVTYAFNTIELKIIEACTHKNNEHSTKLLQKLNFEKTEIIDETNLDLIIFRLKNKKSIY